ncbi:MAG: KamA family radical SAM protein [Planctomycetota bacterium]|jgi:KamA family protein
MILEPSPRYRAYTQAHLDDIPQVRGLAKDVRFEMRVVSSVLPFRVNEYVIEHLIQWDRVPHDPVYQLVFPQRGMLTEEHYDRMAELVAADAPKDEIKALADEIRADLNPHPAGQQELNVPMLDGEPMKGLQHKYKETVLLFPAQGQTCHAYCTFCFRWAQFIGDQDLKFAQKDADQVHRYLAAHPEARDLLVTGGDPMVMRSKVLRQYLEPLLDPTYDHITDIRIGSKSLTFWPYRFTTDDDADDTLRLFEKLADAGKHVAFMAHFEHAQEFDTPVAHEAIRRLRDAGVIIRCQAPLVRHINDDATAWSHMWQEQVRLGMVPYYMFVERDTGAKAYFELPLAEAYQIYRDAIRDTSGLARTARGPSMSCEPGKVEVQGIAEIGGEKVFVLRFIQARMDEWVQRPFFAKFDPNATWFDQLVPAFGEQEFFFEADYRALKEAKGVLTPKPSARRNLGAPAQARSLAETN